MDLVTLAFIAIICVAGGFIAVYADKWGRAIGKSRRSLFGLRPRRTAEVIIAAGGVLIPLLTIAIVFALSSDVRQWLLEGQKAIREAKQLTVERDRLTNERDQRLKEIEGLDKRNKTLLSDKELLQEQVKGIRIKASEFEKAANDTRIRLAEMTKEAAVKRKELDKLAGEKTALDAQLTIVAKKLGSMSESYQVLNVEYAELDKEYGTKLQDIDRLNKTIAQQTADKEKLEKDLDAIQATYKLKVQELANKQAELGSVQKDLAEVQQDLLKKSDELNQLATASSALLLNPPIYSRGDEVARLQVGMNLTPQEARAEIGRLMRSARTAAESAGARATANRPSAGLVPLELEDHTKISAEEQLDMLIKSMTGLADPVVLVASANFNSFKGLPVALAVKLYRNPVIFKQGDFIADRGVDGAREVGEILIQLQEYFRDQVRANALRKGMIPILGREDSFGTVSSDQVLDLVWRLKQVGHSIRVQAIATADTRAGDPLRLEYRLR